MSENPYQAPSSDALPGERPPMEMRSYHVPFIIAAACVAALVIAYNIVPREARATERGLDFFGVCFGVIGAILVFDLAACGLVIWEWWRTGEPPELNFEPLIPCAERRALYRAWKTRPQLDDEAFYQAFYIDSGIAKEVVVEVRREFQAVIGRSLAGVHPSDDVTLADPELDAADLYDRLDDVFQIAIPWRAGKLNIDYTFDSLVRLVAECMAKTAPGE